ncbi:MAG: GNAT family N-acetyltransferase [Pseudomonadota bacterium]
MAGLALTIRVAEARDVEAIARLLADDAIGATRESPGDPAYAEAFARMAEQSGNVYLLAEAAGQLVGCLQYTLIHGLSRMGAARAQIEGVRVAASARGQGIGEALFRAAFARAQDDRASLVQLTTDRDREDALRFYERLGFEATHWGMKRLL